ncbi:MAG: hypothetical protein MR531_06215 [Lachnospiraceae bacterium]|nr:hypothetical protein [Lachnospiraceae bacterium]
MKRTNLVNKSVKLLMSIIIASSVVAMGSNGTVAATLTNNDTIISSIVMAAETTMFTGTYNYVQNDAGNPEPAVIVQPDGSVAVALFQGTMIQINSNVGVVPQILAGTEVAASVVAPEGNGILIAGNAVGSGVIQVQNTATGAISNIVVNVVASADVPAATQVVSSHYYYEDEYTGAKSVPNGISKIYTDGVIKVYSDSFRYNSPHDNYQATVYVDSDKMLTVETYKGIRIAFTVYLNDEYLLSKYNTTSYITGDCDKLDRIVYITTDGRYGIVEENEPTGAPYVPIRVITKGDVSDKWIITYERNGITYTSHLVDLPWHDMPLLNREATDSN